MKCKNVCNLDLIHALTDADGILVMQDGKAVRMNLTAFRAYCTQAGYYVPSVNEAGQLVWTPSAEGMDDPTAVDLAALVAQVLELPDELVQLVNGGLQTLGGTAVPVGANIEILSYTGTGGNGSSNPTSKTFSDVPKIVIVVANNTAKSGTTQGGLMIFAGSGWYMHTYVNSDIPSGNAWDSENEVRFDQIVVTFSGKQVTWYGATSRGQCNYSGAKYLCIGIW